MSKTRQRIRTTHRREVRDGSVSPKRERGRCGVMHVLHFRVPCWHEIMRLRHDEQVDDYHPLTREEVKFLLRAAGALAPCDDMVQAISSIQCRLGQGIPGSKCPHDIRGPVAERSAKLDSLFVHRYEEGATDSLVSAVCELLEIA